MVKYGACLGSMAIIQGQLDSQAFVCEMQIFSLILFHVNCDDNNTNIHIHIHRVPQRICKQKRSTTNNLLILVDQHSQNIQLVMNLYIHRGQLYGKLWLVWYFHNVSQAIKRQMSMSSSSHTALSLSFAFIDFLFLHPDVLHFSFTLEEIIIPKGIQQ